MSELAKVKAKIIALSRKTLDNGCSEFEAMSAMAKMGELLSQYNLTMEECDVRESKCLTVEIPVPALRRTPIDNCVTSLAKLFYGRCWFSNGYKSWRGNVEVAKYCFFVQQHDVEALEYIFAIIWEALDTEAETFKETETYKLAPSKKAATNCFQRGMSSRIADRLIQMRKDAEWAMQNAKSDGTALIVLKGQLIDKEYEDLGMKLRKNYSRRQINNINAFCQGMSAGDNVNLNRPIGGNDKVSGYLS